MRYALGSKKFDVTQRLIQAFSDINQNHPAYKYVQAFVNAGFAVGYEDKAFKPDQAITREEMID